MHKSLSRPTAAAVLITLALGAGTTAGAAVSVPSGQRTLGQSVVEPVYDADHAGEVAFISSAHNGHVEAAPAAVAPIYLPVYPTSSTVGALICPHTPVDTCPDHGPGIAALAQATVPGVYGSGVAGHDHLMALHTGEGFGVTLEPTVVLFTSAPAANEHLLTRQAIEAAIERGDAITVSLPGATLHGQQVSPTVWKLASPVV